jgi:hypothetical protein
LFALPLSAQVSKFAPSALRVGVDPGTVIYNIFSEKRNFYEVTADIDIHKYFFVADYGHTTFDLNDPTFAYHNEGNYLRFGADLNLMYGDRRNNVSFFGLRYAMASFSDEMNFSTSAILQSDNRWPATMETTGSDNLSAHWYEMVTGLKVRMIKQLYFGFTVRFKMFMKAKGTEDLKPYYIPGFGKNISKSYWGFNYYVSYRFPFRKKTIVPKKDDK